MDFDYRVPFTYKANTGFNFYWNQGTFTGVLRMFREGKPAKLFWSIHSHQDAIEVAEDPEHTLVIFESLY